MRNNSEVFLNPPRIMWDSGSVFMMILRSPLTRRVSSLPTEFPIISTPKTPYLTWGDSKCPLSVVKFLSTNNFLWLSNRIFPILSLSSFTFFRRPAGEKLSVLRPTLSTYNTRLTISFLFCGVSHLGSQDLFVPNPLVRVSSINIRVWDLVPGTVVHDWPKVLTIPALYRYKERTGRRMMLIEWG